LPHVTQSLRESIGHTADHTATQAIGNSSIDIKAVGLV